MTSFDKIYGGLVGAAIGDCMGAATEMRPTSLIIQRFGGLVEDFVENPDDTFLRGKPSGYATDDFSLAYFIAKAIVEDKGIITNKTAEKALLAWSDTDWYEYAGNTTRAAVNTIKGIENPPNRFSFLVCENSKATNGSAMKIGPVGLASKGDVDKAIMDSITINMPTHDNNISLSGGAAVAAAVAKALHDNVTLNDLVEAGLYGAKLGYEKGNQIGKILAGPSVEKRIYLAAEIGAKANGDVYKAMYEIADIIGSGLACAEAVPAAFGLMVAANGDAIKPILGGVNIGDDTDTVATIVGAMVGTLNGYKAYTQRWIDLIEKENNFNLEKLAKDIDSL